MYAMLRAFTTTVAREYDYKRPEIIKMKIILYFEEKNLRNNFFCFFFLCKVVYARTYYRKSPLEAVREYCFRLSAIGHRLTEHYPGVYERLAV